MANESYGGFFQFPLALLASSRPFSQILDLGFGWAVVGFIDSTAAPGTARFRQMKATEQDAEMERARKVMGFSGGAAKRTLVLCDEAKKFVTAFEEEMGPTCSVRLRKDLYFDARDKNDPTEREARILCGLYSVIGAKPYAKIGWPMIQARAAGFTRPMEFPLPNKSAPGPLYSRHQIDRTCAELVARGLVSTVTYNNGERFWSHSLSLADLCEKVMQRKTVRALKAQQQQQANVALSREIAAKLNALELK